METIEPSHDLARPRAVAIAFQLLAASLGVGLLNAILHLAQVKVASRLMLILPLIIVVAVLGLAFTLLTRIAARRNWARIVWLVLILCGLPFVIPANFRELGRNVLLGMLSLTITVLQMVGTYLLFTRDSNLWFRTRK
jgi:hypothetical protein